ncbi:MAG: YigZ family protein [Anaerovoracaceae bacterium]
MIRYKTVLKEASIEQIIEKSRFIGYIKPVESKEEADEFFAGIRQRHKDASHNVPAFVIGEQSNLQWASDDGEPQGTSGAPIVQMLVKEGITNVAIMVTRYFGGIKLGTGGLVRAYTGMAKAALAESGVCYMKEFIVLRVRVEYPLYGRLQNLEGSGEFQILDSEFEEMITLELAMEPENLEKLRGLLGDLSGGGYEELGIKEVLTKVPLL